MTFGASRLAAVRTAPTKAPGPGIMNPGATWMGRQSLGFSDKCKLLEIEKIILT
jgi:hypothetical protein